MEINLDLAIDSIEKQLKDYVGDRKAIVGLSGGIDSTVIAYLCVRALGKENVLGISMPCREAYDKSLNVSSIGSIDDAELVAKDLDIEFLINDIGDVVNAFVAPKDDLTDLTKGNIMARVRMVTLYMYANQLNGMVIGTTNKTEAEIGYYTKYGDGAVDIEPIADLYKTEVWEVARKLGVPEKIIEKKPSAELWGGHSDEDELGMTYQEMDEMFKAEEHYITGLKDLDVVPEEWEEMINRIGVAKHDKLCAMVKNSQHKKEMPPAFKVR